jgi:RNA polymerase sigma factor (sigma-70 family)
VGVQDALVSGSTAGEIERVYRQHGAKLWRSLLAFTGDPDVASDALAEALAQALARGEGVVSPDRWVWRAAFKIAAGELKDRRRRMVTPLEPRANYDLPEPATDLIRALHRLTPMQRAVAVLCLYADRSTRDVASILGITQATVRVHLSRARRRLRTLLEDQE